MTKPIGPHFLEQARRMTLRRVAATLVTCMAESDMDFSAISKRLDLKEEDVRAWLYEFIDAKSMQDDLRRMADFAFATGFMLQPTVKPVRLIAEDEPTPQRAAA
jgi:hypothetical protein